MANMASRPRDEIDELDVQVPLKLLHHSGLPQQVEPEKGKGDLNDDDDDDGDDDGGKYYMEGGRVGGALTPSSDHGDHMFTVMAILNMVSMVATDHGGPW